MGIHLRSPWPLLGATYRARLGQFSQRSILRGPIQRGTLAITSTATATITAVDTAAALLHYNGGSTPDTNNSPTKAAATLELTNATTVTGTKTDAISAVTASYEVSQYWRGLFKSIQRGSVTLSSATSGTATITAVTAAKAINLFGGSRTTNAIDNTSWAKIVLTNATTVTVSQGLNTATTTIAPYQVAEFY